MLALALPRASLACRVSLLDWMLSLQPLDVPNWSLVEQDQEQRQARVRRSERRRESSFEQPPSAALQGELRSLLTATDPQTRRDAAETLLSWPEAAREHQQILSLFLEEKLELGSPARQSLARLLIDREPPTDLSESILARWLELCQHQKDLTNCLSWLPRVWESGPPLLAARAEALLQRIPAEHLMPVVSAGVERNRLAYVDLLQGPILQTPEVQRILDKLDSAGEQFRAAKLRRLLVEGCLRPPAADDRAVEELRSRLASPDATRDRASLLKLTHGKDVEQIRSALKELARVPDGEVIERFKELTQHRRPRVRSLAWRCLRKTADRRTYLQTACAFLDDDRPEVQRSAIRVVCHARYRPAIRTVVALLLHKSPQVEHASAEGLLLFGRLALPALIRARQQARPDRKQIYQGIISAIQEVPE